MLALLIHMFLLSDVASTCPAENNPLTLAPPEVVIKYGGEDTVNCTSITGDFIELYWMNENGRIDTEEDDLFISWSFSASDWNVKASCKIKLNDSFECSKDPKITVYKSPDRVVLHPVSVMVEGRQHELQCDIINVAPVQNLTVRWYKNDKIIMTNSFDKMSITPVNESSVLPVNISRGENGVVFRCEAQLDFDSDTLVTSDILNVSVHYPPELKNNSIDVYYVEEGTDVTLKCEADGNPPPLYHWTSDGENMLENTNKLSLTIAKISESATYNCTATNYLGSETKQIHVYVNKIIATTAAAMTTPAESAPEHVTDCSPTLMPSELVVRFGDSASINCSTSVPNFEGMGWEASLGGTGFIQIPFAAWRVDKLEVWNPEPFCFVTLQNSQQCISRPSITVYKSPDRVVLHPVSVMVEGRQHELQCDIINVAPVQNLTVRWYKNDKIIMTNSFDKMSITPVNESSVLPVNISRGENGVVFRCEAQLDFDSDTLVTSDISNVSVHYPPELKNNSIDIYYVEEGTDVTLKCEADGNPPPLYHWTSDGENMLENTNKLSLTIAKISESATYNCTATNYLGSETKQIHVYVNKIIVTTAAAMTTPAESAPEHVTDCSPTLMPSELVVRFGDSASINCSTSVPNFEGMGWEASLGGTGFIQIPFATWRVDKLEVWNPEPFCFVTLQNSQQCISRPSITVYKTPDLVSVSSNSHEQMVEGTEHQLRCDIFNVAPVRNLTVVWYRGSEHVWTEMFNHHLENTWETPQNLSSTLTVIPERGYNGTPFTCKAQLHLGPKGPKAVSTNSKPYTAFVHFAPTFTQKNHSKEISLGKNVTFGCHAEGNPAPEIHWHYTPAENVRETTWGRQKNITIEGATSTNAGVYMCVATNEIGEVTRFVTLTIKGEAAKSIMRFPWWYILLLILIIGSTVIFILIFTVHTYKKKKHGNYSFIPVKVNGEIPLTINSAARNA